MPVEPHSESFFEGPTYALVIGISEYSKKGPEAEGKAEEKAKGIPNLKYAANDATDFVRFLSEEGKLPPDAIIDLINEGATSANIRQSFLTMRRRCEESAPTKPLVFIFFSGHGMAEFGEHYLVTYGAERGKLAGTALPNDEFGNLVAKLKTDRLVVFLDACHSGSAKMGGPKGVQNYELPKGLGEGAGRCLIASCLANQLSWEWDERKSGIFTAHLLELLRNGTEDIPDVYINAEQLVSNLRTRVKKTAETLYQEEQVVDNNAAHLSELRLGINWPQWRKKKQTDKKRLEFVASIKGWLDHRDVEFKSASCARLKRYAEKGDKSPGFETFYAVFDDEFCRLQESYNDNQLADACQLIAAAYIEGAKPAKPAGTKLETESQTPPKSDSFAPPPAAAETATEKTVTPLAAPVVVPTAPLMPAETVADEKRQFSEEDQKYLLAPISADEVYWKESKILEDGLAVPISSAQFRKLLQVAWGIKKSTEDPLDAIMERFKEKWANATVVEATNPLNARLHR